MIEATLAAEDSRFWRHPGVDPLALARAAMNYRSNPSGASTITQQTIIDAVNEQLNVNLDRHQVESQPLREEGEHSVRIRLTFDLIPEIKVTIESEEEEQQDEQLDETGKKPRSEKIEDIVEAEELAAVEKAAEEETEEIVGAEDLTAAEKAVEEEISESNEQETENE